MTSAGIPGDPRRMEITYLGIPRNPRRLEIDWDLKRMPDKDILKIAQGPRELEILAKGLGSQAVPQDCESPGSREPRRVKIVWDKKGSQKHCKKHPEPMQDKQTLPKLAEGGQQTSSKKSKGRPRGRRNETPKASKTPPKASPESIGSNGQKKQTGPPGFDKAPGGSNVTFSNVFSLSEHPPVSPVLGPVGIILGPDLVPVYMYISIYMYIYIM